MWQAWDHFWLAVAHTWLSGERQVTHESEIPKRSRATVAKLSKLKGRNLWQHDHRKRERQKMFLAHRPHCITIYSLLD